MPIAKLRSPAIFIPALSLLFLAIAGIIVYFHFNRHLSDAQVKTWEQAFLKHHYGKFDKKHLAWRAGKTGSDGVPQYWMRVCSESQVSIKGEPHVLLALCGIPGHEDGAHGEGGRHDFYVLKEDADGQQFVQAAQLQGYIAGSFGHPADVNLIRLGNNFYGFDLNFTWTGQGQTFGTRALIVPHEKTLVEAAGFRTELERTSAENCSDSSSPDSNTASADSSDPAGEACVSLKFEMLVDDSQPDLAIYPISVHETGTDHQNIVDHAYSLRFMPKKGVYQVPVELVREE